MKTKWKLAVLACAAVLLLSACASASQSEETPEQTAPETSGEAAPVAGEYGDTGEAPGNADQPAGSEDAANSADETVADETFEAATEPEILKATGEFVGLADANSAEIIVDGEPVPFRFAEGFDSSVLEEMEPGTKLELEYYQEPVEGDDSLKINKLVKVEIVE